MGWGSGFNSDHREVGYAIEAECDREGCTAPIDRGMGYCCGGMHNGMRDDDEPGCGDYFCPIHDGDHDCPNPDGHAYDDVDAPLFPTLSPPDALEHRP
jgi:hypothetical protein